MKEYKPSQELVDILLNHGFVEDTHINYSEHALRFNNKPYDPYVAKRHFKYPGTRETILFDYINMCLSTGIQCYRLNSDDLRSLIAYCQLSSSDRLTLENDRYNALSIPEISGRLKRSPAIYNRIAYRRAVTAFDSIADID